MSFHSVAFVGFAVVTLLLYWSARAIWWRLGVLLVSSFIFYGWQHAPSTALLAATIAVNFAFGLALARWRHGAVLAAAIGVNLASLVWFKYGAFLHLRDASGFLPLGISFFTFQVIAYQVDVYRGTIAAERSPLVFGVFKSFFPQLIAGPIVRAEAMLPTLRQAARFDAAKFQHGIYLFATGMMLKVAVADVLAQFVDDAFAAPDALATSTAWLRIYVFAAQLLADFWGYSTMARGLAALFGLDLPRNFAAPYGATSLQEFWRRWHMTLSAWFRDYVYIPLGGRRRRAVFNTIATMGLAGLWHGASGSFLLWGLLHGLWLVAERACRWHEYDQTSKVARVWRRIVVFHGVCVLWVLFRAPTLAVAETYARRLFLPPYSFCAAEPGVMIALLAVFGVGQAALTRSMEVDGFPLWCLRRQIMVTMLWLAIMLVYAEARYDFIYFVF